MNHKCPIEPQPLCAGIFSVCDLEKIDAAQACTGEEANQGVLYPGESVRDTIQKPACAPLDPTVQLGSMIYSGYNPQALTLLITWQRKTLRVTTLTGAGGITEE